MKSLPVPHLIRMVGLVLLAALVISATSALEAKSFDPGTKVIPFDDKQMDRWQAFGFVHMLLAKGVPIYRIIEPPDVTLQTNEFTGVYEGGPVLVVDPIPADVTAAFPGVTVHTLSSGFFSDQIFTAKEPTSILVIEGVWGHTEQTLTLMGIPRDVITKEDFAADPSVLEDYDLLVVDCPGWSWTDPPAEPPQNVKDAIEVFAETGGEVIFTDIALDNLDDIFPGYATIVVNSHGTWPFTVHNLGEYLSQYAGPEVLNIFTMVSGRIATTVLSPDAKIILDSEDYGPGSEYRIGVFYFLYGEGVVEGFAYHPQDQPTPESQLFAAILYGDKFIHAPPPPVVTVEVDIKPGSCPNAFNALQKGVTSVAVLGSPDFDVYQIDPATVTLNTVPPLRWSTEDVSAPVPDIEDCGCWAGYQDGYPDLVLKFDSRTLATQLGPYTPKGYPVTLTLTGKLLDGRFIEGFDCVWVVKGTPVA